MVLHLFKLVYEVLYAIIYEGYSSQEKKLEELKIDLIEATEKMEAR